MIVAFIIGGFSFFILMMYFVVLILYPEWVGVSGRDHKKSLEQHKESATPVEDKKGELE